jgi:hypothetical protein
MNIRNISEIMESFQIPMPYTHIPRNVRTQVIDALRAIPGFKETTWTNSFCHGRYASPSAKWEAQDSSGHVTISWSVNAASGTDNGYFISQESHWEAETLRSEARYRKCLEENISRCHFNAMEEHRRAESAKHEAEHYLLRAFRMVTTAARVRRSGDHKNAAQHLAWAAMERRGAKSMLDRTKGHQRSEIMYRREAAQAQERLNGTMKDQIPDWELELAGI